MQPWTWTLGTRFSLVVTQDPTRNGAGVGLDFDVYPQTGLTLRASFWSVRLMYQWVWINKA